MNIGKDRKNAIKALYKKGISKDEIQLVSGMSMKTINEILTPANSSELETLLNEINNTFQAIKYQR